MKIKMIRPTIVDGQRRAVGEVVDVSERLGVAMMQIKKAVLVEEVADDPNAKGGETGDDPNAKDSQVADDPGAAAAETASKPTKAKK